MTCPYDDCDLDVPKLSSYKPEKIIYTLSDNISTITCDEIGHFLNTARERRIKVGACDCITR